MAKLEFRGVSKSYQGQMIIHPFDLIIEDGEFVVIVGPSGCGKSTVLRMVAGLEELTMGNIYIDDQCVSRQEAKDRDIAMVFQNYALYPHMSAYDNMAYGLKIRRMSKKDIDERVNAAAEALNLKHLLQRKPRELSGGQRQRVAMGRAMVRQPKIFLFDEPLSNLDAKLRVKMRHTIKKLHRDLGITCVYVTHDQTEAMTLADRIVVLNAGKIEQVDSPLNVYLHPATRFVAGFIGSPAMNFLPVKVVEEGRAVTLADGTLLYLQKPISSLFSSVILGIRPEMMKVETSQHQNQNMPSISLVADWVEALGTDTYVYGRLQGYKESLTVRLSGKYRVEPGEILHLTFMMEYAHIFDVDTEDVKNI